MSRVVEPQKTAGTRSTKGCWTCRLRRKKCDETHPSCRTCACLRITCRGYGPRPPWMDRGPREREEAQKVKNAIAKGWQRRRSSSLGSFLENGGPPLDSRSFDQNSTVDSVESRLLSPAMDSGLDQIFALSSPVELLDDYDQIGLQSPRISYEETLVGDAGWPISRSFDGQAADEGSLTLSELLLPADKSGGPSTTEEDEYAIEDPAIINDPLDDISCQPLEALGSRAGADRLDAGEPVAHHLPVSQTISKSSLRMDLDTLQPMGAAVNPIVSVQDLPPGWHFPFHDTGQSFRNSGAQGELEIQNALWLSHYITHVLPMQIGLTATRDDANQQWLLFCIFRSHILREISAVLGKAHLDADHSGSGSGDDNVTKAVSSSKRLPSAAAIMCLLDDQRRIREAIVNCTCLLQIMYLEMFHGGSRYWASCLEQVAPYMQLLLDECLRGDSELRLGNPAEEPKSNRLQAASAGALLGQFVWFDIMAAVSTGDGPFLGVNLAYLQDLAAVDMREVSGCSNEVAKAICDIFTLQQWKKQAEKSHRLSIIELASRGGAVLASLSSFLAGTGTETENAVCLAYARAAIVYLHVVMSGPNPHLDEIRREVREITKLFESIAADSMTRFAAWPLCVASCFAEEEELRRLGRLVNVDQDGSPIGGRQTHGACIEALAVAEECRRRRKEEGENGDWVQAMSALDRRVLLA